ncbi:MAG: DUF104 domain-containing protein [Planctomycetes bacterium]|nr:DUF104 domain-containing protein [Planctomycetota bacterium]
MQSIHATFQQGIFKPVHAVELPEGCRVELQIILSPEPTQKPGQHDNAEDNAKSDADTNGKTLQERLAQLATQVPLHEWDSLPVDISDRLDDYLYGNGLYGSESK